MFFSRNACSVSLSGTVEQVQNTVDLFARQKRVSLRADYRGDATDDISFDDLEADVWEMAEYVNAAAPKISFAKHTELQTLDYSSAHAFDFETLRPSVRRLVLNRQMCAQWFCIPGVVNGLYDVKHRLDEVVIFTYRVRFSALLDMALHVNAKRIMLASPWCLFCTEEGADVEAHALKAYVAGLPKAGVWVAVMNPENVGDYFGTPVASAVMVGMV